MPKSIVLHPTLGVNPRLSVTICRLCGKEEEGKDLFLLGNKDYVADCPGCGAKVYGGMDKEGPGRFR